MLDLLIPRPNHERQCFCCSSRIQEVMSVCNGTFCPPTTSVPFPYNALYIVRVGMILHFPDGDPKNGCISSPHALPCRHSTTKAALLHHHTEHLLHVDRGLAILGEVHHPVFPQVVAEVVESHQRRTLEPRLMRQLFQAVSAARILGAEFSIPEAVEGTAHKWWTSLSLLLPRLLISRENGKHHITPSPCSWGHCNAVSDDWLQIFDNVKAMAEEMPLNNPSCQQRMDIVI